MAGILAAEAIPEGTVLRFQPGSEMSVGTRKTVLAWVGGDEKRGQAAWQVSASAPLVWAVDGHAYSPTGLVRHLASQAGVEIDSMPGRDPGVTRRTTRFRRSPPRPTAS